MEVIYFGQDFSKYEDKKKSGNDFVALWGDNWDDFDYQTVLNAHAFIDGERIDLPRLKLLFEDVKVTRKYLNELIDKGWNGVFPLDQKKYISLPVSIDFYELIIGHLGLSNAVLCAEVLCDASFNILLKEDSTAIEMSNAEGFSVSLLRDRSAAVALDDGWRLFGKDSIEISNFDFNFALSDSSKSINFKFEENLLPHDINVLVGPNGCGKSQTLHKMVNKWLDPSLDNEDQYSQEVNIRKMIVVSYSPFELFPVDLNSYKNISDTSVYNYFGLRRRSKTLDKSKTKIRLSRNYPKIDAVRSIFNCIVDDIKFKKIENWSNKVNTMREVLLQAIDFDFIAVELSNKVNVEELVKRSTWDSSPIFSFKNKKYLKIANEINWMLNIELIKENLIESTGVCFFHDGNLVELSSGQRLFSYIVINILGAIKKNSLVIVDEPELFLHPTLEIAFVSMLKEILKKYFSKAILATHSLVTVREIPNSCVHVFKKEMGNCYINSPPFETFGGDIQRISSYVFGDKSVSKPYENWIAAKLAEYGTSKSLIDALGSNINEEMIVQIHAMESKQWS
jgi:ABC-type cobalamin/Fe3+-siderophores transport system ATPase subunit